jgi:hypothetical protein
MLLHLAPFSCLLGFTTAPPHGSFCEGTRVSDTTPIEILSVVIVLVADIADLLAGFNSVVPHPSLFEFGKFLFHLYMLVLQN